MSNYIKHVATLEIPVSNVQQSIDWYENIFNLNIHFKSEESAMLSFESKGVPTIYLVQTDEIYKLSFRNSNTSITHSVIDFYTEQLSEFYNWLKEKKVNLSPLNIDPNNGFGGFSFEDPDGNKLGVTNILHPGQ
ncbi:VOC family protein [Lysinibacillus capsici]|uniref:VOC family protein n=1 Tax=Lysinibacillus capsici TaxID=2115968 RepID=UPI001B62C7C9